MASPRTIKRGAEALLSRLQDERDALLEPIKERLSELDVQIAAARVILEQIDVFPSGTRADLTVKSGLAVDTVRAVLRVDKGVSMERILAKTGLNVNTARSALRQLIDMGTVAVVRKIRPKTYGLTFEPLESEDEPPYGDDSEGEIPY